MAVYFVFADRWWLSTLCRDDAGRATILSDKMTFDWSRLSILATTLYLRRFYRHEEGNVPCFEAYRRAAIGVMISHFATLALRSVRWAYGIYLAAIKRWVSHATGTHFRRYIYDDSPRKLRDARHVSIDWSCYWARDKSAIRQHLLRYFHGDDWVIELLRCHDDAKCWPHLRCYILPLKFNDVRGVSTPRLEDAPSFRYAHQHRKHIDASTATLRDARLPRHAPGLSFRRRWLRWGRCRHWWWCCDTTAASAFRRREHTSL